MVGDRRVCIDLPRRRDLGMSMYTGEDRSVWVSVCAFRQGQGGAGSLPGHLFFSSILLAASQHVNFTFDEHISLSWILKGVGAALASLRHFRWGPGV